MRGPVPPPPTISAAARRFLAAGPATPLPTPALDDIQGWRTYVAVRDAEIAVRLAARRPSSATVAILPASDPPIHVGRPVAVRGDGLCLSFHGGALLLGGGPLVAYDAARVADQTGLETWSLDYRRPPDHPFPAALDDAEAAYRALLDIAPAARLVVAGVSAGGNIAAALMHRLKAARVDLPSALILRTPEVDLTEAGDSFSTGLGLDTILTSSLLPLNRLYAGGCDLADPLVSPLFGDFSGGWPPTLLQSGTRDLFLSNTVRLHRRLRDAGHDAELHVWEAMPHGGFGGDTPEDSEIDAEIRRFLARH